MSIVVELTTVSVSLFQWLTTLTLKYDLRAIVLYLYTFNFTPLSLLTDALFISKSTYSSQKVEREREKKKRENINRNKLACPTCAEQEDRLMTKIICSYHTISPSLSHPLQLLPILDVPRSSSCKCS